MLSACDLFYNNYTKSYWWISAQVVVESSCALCIGFLQWADCIDWMNEEVMWLLEWPIHPGLNSKYQRTWAFMFMFCIRCFFLGLMFPYNVCILNEKNRGPTSPTCITWKRKRSLTGTRRLRNHFFRQNLAKIINLTAKTLTRKKKDVSSLCLRFLSI